MPRRKPPHHPGLEHEPHLRASDSGQQHFTPDASEHAADRRLAAAGPDAPAVRARHDVFDEPTMRATVGTPIDRDWSCDACGFNLRGLAVGHACPECGHPIRLAPTPAPAPGTTPGTTPGSASSERGQGYAAWLTECQAQTSAARTWLVTLGIALAGGPWAVLGALLSTFGGTIAIIVVAPVVEEVMKVALITLLIETRPYLLRTRAQIYAAAAGSGLAFATIENLIYLNLYIPNPTPDIIAWRWIVCTVLHVGCALVAAVGADRVWRQTLTERRPPTAPIRLRWLVLAIALHGTYNAAEPCRTHRPALLNLFLHNKAPDPSLSTPPRAHRTIPNPDTKHPRPNFFFTSDSSLFCVSQAPTPRKKCAHFPCASPLDVGPGSVTEAFRQGARRDAQPDKPD
ncbi:MAG: PrsW family glutamic-type intramembrane protease [Planctomycetota bacterium]